MVRFGLFIDCFLLTLVFCSCLENERSTAPAEIATDSIADGTAPEHDVIIPEESFRMIDQVYFGMTFDEMKVIYADCEFFEESVWVYGVDSEHNGIRVERNGEPLFFAWAFEGLQEIVGISVLSPDILVDDVYVGMTVTEYFALYPDALLMIDELTYDEFSSVRDRFLVEFLTTDENRIGVYEQEAWGAEWVGLARPDAPIDRVVVYDW